MLSVDADTVLYSLLDIFIELHQLAKDIRQLVVAFELDVDLANGPLVLHVHVVELALC